MSSNALSMPSKWKSALGWIVLLSWVAVPLFGQPKSLREMEQYLMNCGYTIHALEQVYTKGATDCHYFVPQTPDKRYFIKTGEKVDIEVKNYLKLGSYLKEALSSLAFGSSEKEAILILDYIEQPDYGFMLVDGLYKGQILEDTFITSQKEIFQQVSRFYAIPIDQEDKPSRLFVERIQERLKALLDDQDKTFIDGSQLGWKQGLNLRDLLHTPVTILDSSGQRTSFSICHMVEEFSKKMASLPAIRPVVLHGDFHASNLGRDSQKRVKFLDLSDVKYGEDPAWDLGKWLNHVFRLHLVVCYRHLGYPDENIELRKEGNNIFIINSSPKPAYLDEIRHHAIEDFAPIVKASPDLLKVRAAAAEFIVNVSTLKRHLKLFPCVTG